MDLQDLGNIGEFIGSIAVVATLFYLVLQVKQNTAAIRQQSYSDLIARRQALFDGLSSDLAKTENLYRGLSANHPNMADAQLFAWQIFNHLYHYQDCMIQHNAGIVEDDMWEAEKKMLGSIVDDPGFISIWAAVSQFFTSDFVALVESLKGTSSHIDYDLEKQQWHRTKDVPSTG